MRRLPRAVRSRTGERRLTPTRSLRPPGTSDVGTWTGLQESLRANEAAGFTPEARDDGLVYLKDKDGNYVGMENPATPRPRNHRADATPEEAAAAIARLLGTAA